MRMTRPACCARAVSGQAATPPRSAMNSRRLITDPEVSGRYWHNLAHQKRPMSALGQKQTYALQQGMSALPPKATAKADIRKRSCPLYPRKRTCAMHKRMSALGHKRTFACLFDHLIGDLLHVQWHGEAQRLRCLEIDDQRKLDRKFDWQRTRALAL